MSEGNEPTKPPGAIECPACKGRRVVRVDLLDGMITREPIQEMVMLNDLKEKGPIKQVPSSKRYSKFYRQVCRGCMGLGYVDWVNKVTNPIPATYRKVKCINCSLKWRIPPGDIELPFEGICPKCSKGEMVIIESKRRLSKTTAGLKKRRLHKRPKLDRTKRPALPSS